MAKQLATFDSMALMVFMNLRQAVNLDGQEQYSTRLLDGFLANNDFQQAVTRSLTTLGAPKTAAEVANYQPVTDNPIPKATINGLIDSMREGDVENFVDLGVITPQQFMNALPTGAALDAMVNESFWGDSAKLPGTPPKGLEDFILKKEDLEDMTGKARIDNRTKGAISRTQRSFNEDFAELDPGEAVGMMAYLAENGLSPALAAKGQPPAPASAPAAPEAKTEPFGPITRDEYITKLQSTVGHGSDFAFGSLMDGFKRINPEMERVQKAIEAQAGAVGTNPIADQLTQALNNDPETLGTFIEIAKDNQKIDALVKTLGTEAGSRNIVFALADVNGQVHSTNAHAAIPLSTKKDIPDLKTVIQKTQDRENPAAPATPEKPDVPAKDAPATDLIAEAAKPEIDPDVKPVLATIAPSIPASSGDKPDDKATPERKAEEQTAKPDKKAEDEPAADATQPKAQEETPERATYTVSKRDNLWKIARKEYGLTKAKDIMRAMDHIARLNPEAVNPNNGKTYNLAEGANAHAVFPGQKLVMPTAEEILKPVPKDQKLDRAALDKAVGKRVDKVISYNDDKPDHWKALPKAKPDAAETDDPSKHSNQKAAKGPSPARMQTAFGTAVSGTGAPLQQKEPDVAANNSNHIMAQPGAHIA